MKKLFFVFAIAALASCNSADKQESTTETSAPATETAAPASTETAAPVATDASTTTATTAH
ncbi:MAG TPA: hypothetical protein VKB95_04165 [Chitinophagaceae bacterium]|nr:hypothetical protein [Chitinophagaceae bacterium]